MERKYITKKDFYASEGYLKIRDEINLSIRLIKRLIDFNEKCKEEIAKFHGIPSYAIDNKLNQFDYYTKVLKCICYGCYSLYNVYETSTYMSHEVIHSTIYETYDDQKKHLTFSSIVMITGMLEFNRNEFESVIDRKNYFENLASKYHTLVDQYKLLLEFRNTVHSNTIWKPKNNKKELVYRLRTGEITIKRGESFQFDYLTLYKIIKDSIELHLLIAKDSEMAQIIKTPYVSNGQPIVAIKTGLSSEDWDRILNEAPKNNIDDNV